MGSLRLAEVMTILRTGRISQVVVVATFAATLFLPVAAAVGGGVVLSLLQLNQEAMDLAVVELGPAGDGRCREGRPPATLPGFARHDSGRLRQPALRGARTLQASYPLPARRVQRSSCYGCGAVRPSGATFDKVMTDHASQLAVSGGRLYLSGVDHGVADQFQRTGQVEGPVRTFEATPVIGESTNAAYLDAEA